MFASSGMRIFEPKGVQIDGWGRDKFISSSMLGTDDIGLCINDTVIFKVEVTVYGDLEPVPLSEYDIDMAASTLSKSLRQLFDRCNPIPGPSSNTLQIGGLSHDVELICTGGGSNSSSNCNSSTSNQNQMSSSLSSTPSNEKSNDTSLVSTSRSSVSNLVKSCVSNNHSSTNTSPPTTTTTNPTTTKNTITLKAHRSILSARSPVFEAMFNADMSECTTGKSNYK